MMCSLRRAWHQPFLLMCTLALAVLPAASCTSTADLTRVVKHFAAEELQCDEPIQTAHAGSLYQARGCGRSATYACSRKHFKCRNLAFLAEARGRSELSCESVRTREVSPAIYLVEGCGMRATYACFMQDGVGRCSAETAPVPVVESDLR